MSDIEMYPITRIAFACSDGKIFASESHNNRDVDKAREEAEAHERTLSLRNQVRAFCEKHFQMLGSQVVDVITKVLIENYDEMPVW